MRDLHRSVFPAVYPCFFEVWILVDHPDRGYVQEAAWEAFRLLDRLECLLSRFIANSDVSRLNRLCAGESLVVDRLVFDCLQRSLEFHQASDGAFDPAASNVEEDDSNSHRARKAGGLLLLTFDSIRSCIRLEKGPVRMDLGGVGKGFALDRLAELLSDWGLRRFLLHGGFSSYLAGEPPGNSQGWSVEIRTPDARRRLIARVSLSQAAISGSGVEKGLHIIDPRTGRAAEGASAAWCLAPHADQSDAFSTAFMIMKREEIERLCREEEGVFGWIINQ